ncbi:MAG TPA: HlyD family secretion protein [Bacteroidales bacterium]|nr:HlyD family secretion protein [Bacteroidales bacterium]
MEIKKKEKKGVRMYVFLTLVVLAVLSAAVIWYRNYMKYISTDDAYIDSDKVAISSKIMGRIAKLYVDEGDSVKKGMLLAELDSTEIFAQKLQFISLKKQAITSKQQVEAKYQFDQQSIKVQEINYQKASDDFQRAKTQYEGGVVTKEQFEHAQKAFEAAKAQYDAAKTQLNVSKAQITNTQASIESSDAQINVSEAQLRNTRLYAPFDGIVAKRWLLAGDIAQPGQSIYTITNDKNFWVSVFIEETKLKGIYNGQEAEYEVDAIPNATFFGKVYSIGSNTASQFSLIPPSNASGNFTKITQRVPLKISIDSIDTKTNHNKVKLLSGMSVVVKLIK